MDGAKITDAVVARVPIVVDMVELEELKGPSVIDASIHDAVVETTGYIAVCYCPIRAVAKDNPQFIELCHLPGAVACDLPQFH